MGKIADECILDTDHSERARALHRVVRAMHDGHCPSCGHLAPSEAFYRTAVTNPHHSAYPRPAGHVCPKCGFHVTAEEAAAALAEFRPYLNKSAEVFLIWRASRARKLPGKLDIDILYAEAISNHQSKMIEDWLVRAGLTKENAGDYYLEDMWGTEGNRTVTLVKREGSKRITSLQLPNILTVEGTRHTAE